MTNLTRRDFLVKSAGAGAGAVAASQLGAFPFSMRGATATTRTLVLVTLDGGNDSLNTLVPYADSRYYAARGTLAIPASSVLKLDNSYGLHPNLGGMKSLWDKNDLAVIRGVGYANSTLSHFRSMDIWQSASPASYQETGWIGRWLDSGGTDPKRAIAVGADLPRVFVGERGAGAVIGTTSMKVPGTSALQSAFATMSQPHSGQAPLPTRVAVTGSEMMSTASALNAALARQAATAGLDKANPLAVRLDSVARLIRDGFPARVYHVKLGGFDTHAGQATEHPALLSTLDKALSFFLSSVASSTLGPGVVVAAYSEFGRRVAPNASTGTDHGKAGLCLVAGAPVKGGFYGEQPDLSNLDDGNLRYTVDFRSVYATLLSGVLGADPAVALGPSYPAGLPFLA